MEAIQTVEISFRETRNLCKKHYNIFKTKNEEYPINFIKASKI